MDTPALRRANRYLATELPPVLQNMDFVTSLAMSIFICCYFLGLVAKWRNLITYNFFIIFLFLTNYTNLFSPPIETSVTSSFVFADGFLCCFIFCLSRNARSSTSHCLQAVPELLLAII